MAGVVEHIGAAALADHGFPVLLPRTIAEVRPTLGVLARPVVGSQARESVLGLGAVRELTGRDTFRLYGV